METSILGYRFSVLGFRRNGKEHGNSKWNIIYGLL